MYGPLLNLKVAQKKTSAGFVPMVRYSYLCRGAGVCSAAEEPVGRFSGFSA